MPNLDPNSRIILYYDKMADIFIGFDGLGGNKSNLQSFIDTSFRFYNMQDFQRKLRLELFHPITKKLWGSGLVEVASFLVAVQALELICESIIFYYLDTK